MRESIYTRRLKRVLDVALAGSALIVLSPLLLLTACAILLDDGPPVLFKQTRTGKSGLPFMFLKFRSMSKDARTVTSAEATTLQVTRVGRVIRRLNIDELPQLLNILRGEMSIVGPRPPIPTQHMLIDHRRESGALMCPPGLTGLAQINAYDGMPEDEKAEWDARYSRKVSLRLDLTIVLRTVTYLFRPPPTY